MTLWNEIEKSLQEVVLLELTKFSEKFSILIEDSKKCSVGLDSLVERYVAMKEAIRFAILKLNGDDLHSWDTVEPLRKELVYGALFAPATNAYDGSKQYAKAGMNLASERLHNTAGAFHHAAAFLGYVDPVKESIIDQAKVSVWSVITKMGEKTTTSMQAVWSPYDPEASNLDQKAPKGKKGKKKA